jgi:small subunit ribosomal protein S17
MAKTLSGKVTSAKADKTITITVTSRETHPIYGKQYTVNRKYIAHDENNDANEGDIVQIIETRPISKRKSFTLKEITKRSQGSIELKQEVNEAVEDKIDHDHDTASEDKA